MDETKRRNSEVRLKSLFQQLHFTVIYDEELVNDVGLRELRGLQDRILDEIIFHQRLLGLRI